MSDKSDSPGKNSLISRRKFLGTSGAVAAGSVIPVSILGAGDGGQEKEASEEEIRIRQFRTLGRTGFEVSDLSMGGTKNKDSNVVRYAYDHGVNYFDTAENYVNGTAEKLIGEALEHMDRKKIFITSKIHVSGKDTETTVLERFKKCLGRLGTDYLDAFLMHGVSDPAALNHEGFHAAVKKLKTEGRLKHIGVSSHGARRGPATSMEDALCAAAEDGRFDIVLVIYNFLNKEAGEKVIAACKKNNVGVTAMKTAPGVLKIDPIDPENLTDEQKDMVERMQNYGMNREQAIERLKQSSKRQEDSLAKTKPFAEKYKIKTADQLQNASIQWVLQDEGVHTVCVSFGSFEQVDRIVPVSGKKLSMAEAEFLHDYKLAYSGRYCRHACDLCRGSCPRELPVSTIMRYAYYYECQGREKFAMSRYAGLEGENGAHCLVCDAPCLEACPHGVDVQNQMLQAHARMTMV